MGRRRRPSGPGGSRSSPSSREPDRTLQTEVKMARSAFTAMAMLLSAVSAGYAATTSDLAAADCGDGPVKGKGPSCSALATAQKAATVKVLAEAKGGAALEVTARPVAGDPSSSYLVQ